MFLEDGCGHPQVDYWFPVGFRIALRHPEWIEGIECQNGHVYEEGFTGVWDAFRTALWKNRTPESEAPLAGFFTADGVKWIYSEGTRNPEKISPENWNNDLFFLGKAQNHRIQLDYSTIIGPTSISIRSGMSIFAGTSRRCSSGGRKRSDLHSGRWPCIPARSEKR
jgi:hypothetical protein